MPPRIEYKEFQIIGSNGLILIKEIEPKGKDRRRQGLFRCRCKKQFNAGIKDVRTGNTTSCGCRQKELASLSNFKHGYSNKDLTYEIWKSIKGRIYNKKNKSYKNYGGRGVGIFPIWSVDFQSFYDYVSLLPHFKEETYSLDRINNDGNYEPGNLRWTTPHVQCANSRKHKNNKSGYTGVSSYKKRWQVNINSKYIGYADTLKDAVSLRNNYIIVNKLSEYKIQ